MLWVDRFDNSTQIGQGELMSKASGNLVSTERPSAKDQVQGSWLVTDIIRALLSVSTERPVQVSILHDRFKCF